MKKSLFLCLMAVVALSCAREAHSPETTDIQFIIHSNQAATKTFLTPSGTGH